MRSLTTSRPCTGPELIRRNARAAVENQGFIGSPSLFEMALNAEIRSRVEMGERLERRAVRAMAAETVDAQVGVTRIGHPFADRVARMLLPVVAVAAQRAEIVPLHQEEVVGGVRLM